MEIKSMQISTQHKKAKIDLQEIIDIIYISTRKLIGEICCKVSFGYGDELFLEFGEKNTIILKNGRTIEEGSWSLGTQASPWFVKHHDQEIFSSELKSLDPENAPTPSKPIVLENKRVVDIQVDTDNLNTIFFFEDNYTFTIVIDLNKDNLPYWELSMPTEQFLSIGGGLFWSCKSINDRY